MNYQRDVTSKAQLYKSNMHPVGLALDPLQKMYTSASFLPCKITMPIVNACIVSMKHPEVFVENSAPNRLDIFMTMKNRQESAAIILGAEVQHLPLRKKREYSGYLLLKKTKHVNFSCCSIFSNAYISIHKGSSGI